MVSLFSGTKNKYIVSMLTYLEGKTMTSKQINPSSLYNIGIHSGLLQNALEVSHYFFFLNKSMFYLSITKDLNYKTKLKKDNPTLRSSHTHNNPKQD